MPIEDVTVGTMVWSHDPTSGDWTLRPVTAVFINEYEGLVVEIDIHAADGTTETITTTAEHPFLVASGEELRGRPAVGDWPAGATDAPATGRWTEARHLRLGDTFVTRTGRSATVTGLTLRLERLRVYNLEVAGTHTYAVGQDGACVHNSCSKLARNLAKYVRAREIGEQAAHIIPKGMRFGQRGILANRLRARLHSFGIGIDDWVNGFWSASPNHGGTHTLEFLGWLERETRYIRSAEEMSDYLRRLGRFLCTIR